MALGTTLECSLAADGEPGFRIPSGALTRTADGRDAVWRFDPATGQVSLAPVEIRSYATGDVLVARGVEPGMRIVTAGVHVLREGQKVKELESAAP